MPITPLATERVRVLLSCECEHVVVVPIEFDFDVPNLVSARCPNGHGERLACKALGPVERA